jgi:hypothetical protein
MMLFSQLAARIAAFSFCPPFEILDETYNSFGLIGQIPIYDGLFEPAHLAYFGRWPADLMSLTPLWSLCCDDRDDDRRAGPPCRAKTSGDFL